MTARLAACRELAEDKQAIGKLIDIYLDIEHGASASSILFSWLPSPSRKARNKATAALYGFLCSYIELRRKDPVATIDTIDALIAEGRDNPTIVAVRNICKYRRGLTLSFIEVYYEYYIRWSYKHWRQW